MKTIPLSVDQENKLVEMATELFPELYDKQDKRSSVAIETWIPAWDAGKFVSFYNDSGTQRIHWYEFCLHALGDKILQMGQEYGLYRMTKSTFRGIISSEADHPVDYLYYLYEKYYNASKAGRPDLQGHTNIDGG